ncbi:MAG: RimK/LysX family protein [Phycisphaerales bacterium]
MSVPVPSADPGVLVLGWREPVSLPEWGITSLKTKVDTGARTSALHVARISPLARGRVRFEVIARARLVEGRRRIRRVPVEAEVHRVALVRSSTGRIQRRLVVRTRALIGPVERVIEVSLVCRRNMRCRLLLGRTALAGFVVDPTRRRVLGRAGAGRAHP